ncbi:MAG TPA: hypothetical protein VN815_06495, partial [Steroidobacteraceae bacterium]|nr:hypothetical protein [Steroidobacteraceae bacterium]
VSEAAAEVGGAADAAAAAEACAGAGVADCGMGLAAPDAACGTESPKVLTGAVAFGPVEEDVDCGAVRGE